MAGFSEQHVVGKDGLDVRIDRLVSPRRGQVLDVSYRRPAPRDSRRVFAVLHGLRLASSLLRTGTHCVYDVQPALYPGAKDLALNRARQMGSLGLTEIAAGDKWIDYPFDKTELAVVEQHMPGMSLSREFYPVGILAELREGWLATNGAPELGLPGIQIASTLHDASMWNLAIQVEVNFAAHYTQSQIDRLE